MSLTSSSPEPATAELRPHEDSREDVHTTWQICKYGDRVLIQGLGLGRQWQRRALRTRVRPPGGRVVPVRCGRLFRLAPATAATAATAEAKFTAEKRQAGDRPATLPVSRPSAPRRCGAGTLLKPLVLTYNDEEHRLEPKGTKSDVAKLDRTLNDNAGIRCFDSACPWARCTRWPPQRASRSAMASRCSRGSTTGMTWCSASHASMSCSSSWLSVATADTRSRGPSTTGGELPLPSDVNNPHEMGGKL